MSKSTTSSRRIDQVRGRPFAVGLSPEVLSRVQAGVMATRYRGVAFLKNPFDVVLYMRLLESLRPRTIIEVGSCEGGSAVWFRDQASALGLDTKVISLDISPPAQAFDGVSFMHGDAGAPDRTFPHGLLASSPHPWLVVEDSAHTYDTTKAVMDYFDRLLIRGDYLVVEDGVVADLPTDPYGRYEDGPNRAVAEFLAETGERYEIDERQCDYFGHNVTYCPNGWLVRR